MLGKLLGVATVGSTLMGVGLLHRFLVAAAQLMILVIISSFMLCASLASIFCIIYFCMMQFGIAPQVAGIILGVVALLTTAVLVALMLDQLQKLRSFYPRQAAVNAGSLPDIGHIAMAFIDGFLDKKS